MFFIKEILNVIVNPVSETRVSSYRAVERHQILSKHKEHIEKFGVFILNFELKRHAKTVLRKEANSIHLLWQKIANN